MFRLKGNYITNEKGKVIAVSGGIDAENRNLIVENRNNTVHQRWRKNVRAQQWYFDEVSKTIKNNNWRSHSLDIQSNGNSSNIRCTTTNSRWW
jgi:hypothetical protein